MTEGALPCPWCDAPLEGEKCAGCGREPIVCKQFRVTKLLGKGGMGTVYAAERTSGKKHQKSVAVKIIAPPTDDDWTAWELFERSSRVLQHLHHRRLPTVHAFERTDRGRLVLVREAFDGGTLEERIAGQDEHIAPERVRKLLDEMLELLVYLQGLVPPVIHRDIKPSNVMFRTESDWDPVLVDFDTIVSRRSGLTIVGTPGYAAPEQFAADASPASDVYGLGATMLFVATHTDADDLPHEHGRFVLDGKLPSLDPKLVSVLKRMVEPDVSKRYATAREVVEDLERKPKPEPVKAPEPVSTTRPPPHATPRRRLVGRYVAAFVSLVVAVSVYLGWRAAERHSREARVERALALLGPDDAGEAPSFPDDEKSCSGGVAESCFTIAWRYDNGNDGVTKDWARAAVYYERACKLGDVMACNNLGVDYQNGYGVDASAPRAVDLYTRACDAKNGLGCRNLALMYEGDAGVKTDYAKALSLFSRGCDLEDGNSCNNLGWMNEAGMGTRKDIKKAASLYGLACDHGYLYACRNSGLAYETGDGVDRDDRRAVALFKRACDGDETSGCLELGRMTKDGRGTAADPARASEAFEKGCKDGVAEACDELARLLAAGNGVAKDVKRAKNLWARACDAGVAESCAGLRALR